MTSLRLRHFYWLPCVMGLLWIQCEPAAQQPPSVTATDAVGRDAGASSRARGGGPLSGRVLPKGRSYRVRMDGVERVRAQDHVDVLATVRDLDRKSQVTVTLLQNVIVLHLSRQGGVALLVLPEEAELLALAARITRLFAVRRHLEDLGVYEERVETDDASLLVQSRRSADRKTRLRQFQARLAGAPGRPMPPGPVKGGREICLPLAGAEGVVAGDHLDVLATVRDPLVRDWVAVTLLADVVVSDHPRSGGCVPVLLIPSECERAVQALRLGELSASLRNPTAPSAFQETRGTTRTVIIHGERPTVFPASHGSTLKTLRIVRGLPGIAPSKSSSARPHPRLRSQPQPKAQPRSASPRRSETPPRSAVRPRGSPALARRRSR